MIEFWNKPCAGPGLVSYRYRGRFGYVMIGARDVSDALREVTRSIGYEGSIVCLEVWDGSQYVRAVCDYNP